MSRHEVHIPIPKNAVEVQMPGDISTYFVDPDPANAEFTRVWNVLGTDGASYKFTPDQVTITSHSTHDRYHNNVETIFKNPSDMFWQHQATLQKVLGIANEKTEK